MRKGANDVHNLCRHSGAIASFIGDGTRNPMFNTGAIESWIPDRRFASAGMTSTSRVPMKPVTLRNDLKSQPVVVAK
jgi:hypothetical protein